jgi:hypothetical protein
MFGKETVWKTKAYTVGNIKIGMKEIGIAGFGTDACGWI